MMNRNASIKTISAILLVSTLYLLTTSSENPRARWVNARRVQVKTLPREFFTKAVNTNFRQLIDLIIAEHKNYLSDVDMNNGNTMLMQAAYENRPEIMRLLIDGGADVDQKTSKGTALTQAAHAGAAEAIQLLINKNANLNQTDEYGNTALIITIHKRTSPHVILIEDVNNPPQIKLKPNMGELGTLYNEGPDYHYYYVIATHEPDLCTAQSLITAGADVNYTKKNGGTALIMAAKNNNIEAMNLLVNAGADLNKVNKNGFSALLWAIKNKNYNAIDFLIQKGADVNQKHEFNKRRYARAQRVARLKEDEDEDGTKYITGDNEFNNKTPLEYATSLNDPRIIQSLIDAKAQACGKNR